MSSLSLRIPSHDPLKITLFAPATRRRVRAMAFGEGAWRICPLSIVEKDGTPIPLPMAKLQQVVNGLYEIKLNELPFTIGEAEDALRQWMAHEVD